MRLAPLARLSCLALFHALLGCSPPPAEAPPPAAPAPPPEAAPPPPPPAVRLPATTVHLDGGCEEAKTAYLKECMAKPSGCADTSKSAGTVSYTSILNDGSYLNACHSPASSAVKVCAAIRGGRAVGVSVTTNPGDDHLATCIGKALQAIAFPSSPGMDVASTTFAAQ